MNKIFSFISAVLCTFAFLSCTQEPVPVQEEPAAAEESTVEFAAGVINVKLSEDLAAKVESDLQNGGMVTKSSSSGLNGLYDELGIISMQRIFEYAGEYEPRTRKAGLHRWYRVTYDPSVTLTKASSDFSGVPGIEIVSPIRNIKTTAFNDPMLGQQWHYYNDGSLSSYHKSGADINVQPVWDNYTVGSDDVTVGVVDGGVDAAHEDLAANYAGGRSFVSGYGVVAHEHGTHVAGTIAAVNNNGTGVCGIAGGDAASGTSGVRILSCQIFVSIPQDPSKDLGGDGAAAIKWAADNGAVISQNSWGYTFENPADGEGVQIEPALRDAVDYFIQYAGCDNQGNQLPDSPMKGGVVIFAAGNDNMPFGPPANYEPIIAVGSISPDFTRAPYSNYGDWVDIAAPGGNTSYTNGGVLSTIPGNRYGWMQGTSMACPHVSGVAALLVSYFGGPGFTNEMLKERLLNGANSSALSQSSRIGPLLDALGAFTYGGTTPPDRVSSFETSVVSNSITATWTVTADEDDRKAYGYMILASKDRSLLENIDFRNIPDGVSYTTVETGSLNVGDRISGSISGLEFETDYYMAVAGYDYNRNYSVLSPVQTVKTLGNNPPVITTDYTGEYQIKSHETLNVNFSISDPDGHQLQITLVPGSDALTGSLNSNTGAYVLQFTGNAAAPGNYHAVLTATDSYGESTSYPIDYTILENHAPEIIKDIEDMVLNTVGTRFTIDMTEHLSDEDGEQLAFSVNISDRNVLHINPSGNILHGTALNYGQTDVSITASDSRNETCTLTFSVLVMDPSASVSVYPNPVTDVLNIRTGGEAETYIRLTSATGATVYESTSMVSAFSPAVIDMSGCAPGRYTVLIRTGDNEFTRTVTKI